MMLPADSSLLGLLPPWVAVGTQRAWRSLWSNPVQFWQRHSGVNEMQCFIRQHGGLHVP